MDTYLKQSLSSLLDKKIEKLLPNLQQNTTAINQSLIYALHSLKDIFAQIELSETITGLLQNNQPPDNVDAVQLYQTQATLICLELSRLIAICLNCTDEDILQETLQKLNSYTENF